VKLNKERELWNVRRVEKIKGEGKRKGREK
jgi:hypothetical protein